MDIILSCLQTTMIWPQYESVAKLIPIANFTILRIFNLKAWSIHNNLSILFSLVNLVISWRMVSYGLLRRLALVRTDVSEEPGAFFIRVTKIGELGTTQAATRNRRTLRRNTKLPSQTSVLTRATRRNYPEDTILHSHGRENLKSYIIISSMSTEILFLKCNWDRYNSSKGSRK
jgi:hypothetical protein